jgi:hypothetical protein
MIVVVMRHDDGIERWQLAQRNRYRLETLRPGKARRRGARSPHGIGQYPHAIDFDEHRRMTEPGGAQAATGRAPPCIEWIAGRKRRARHAPLTAAHELGQRWHRRGRIAQARHQRMPVLEAIARPRGRCAHALESFAARPPAQ